jgi:hypothetical protein
MIMTGNLQRFDVYLISCVITAYCKPVVQYGRFGVHRLIETPVNDLLAVFELHILVTWAMTTCYILCEVVTNVSEEHTASIFKAEVKFKPEDLVRIIFRNVSTNLPVYNIVSKARRP